MGRWTRSASGVQLRIETYAAPLGPRKQVLFRAASATPSLEAGLMVHPGILPQSVLKLETPDNTATGELLNSAESVGSAAEDDATAVAAHWQSLNSRETKTRPGFWTWDNRLPLARRQFLFVFKPWLAYGQCRPVPVQSLGSPASLGRDIHGQVEVSRLRTA